ncbi:MAG TPA: hypothetical protein VGG83_10790 [Trebonia sp.]|jgi:hypothetical protein
MAGVSVVMEPDWLEQLRAAEAVMLEEQFGPAILADMQAATPVQTGRLRDSEAYQVLETGDGPELQIGSFPDDDGPVPYAAATELGFHGEEWVREYETHTGRVVDAHARHGNTPEQSYMRPALYRER